LAVELSPRAHKLIEIILAPLIRWSPPSVGKPVFQGRASGRVEDSLW
jgi:hypothetical protein